MSDPVTVRAFTVTQSRFPALRDSARKLFHGLPDSAPVVIDLAGIEQPSRGFVDELLAICDSRAPRPELVNLSPAAARMIEVVKACRVNRGGNYLEET